MLKGALVASVVEEEHSHGSCDWPVGPFLGGMAVVLYGIVRMNRVGIRDRDRYMVE